MPADAARGSRTPPGIVENEAQLTEVVLRAMADAPDARLREVMATLVKHLHAFLREARLSEAEFETGLDFLNRVGQATSPTHNEAVLLADILGASTLVCLLNNGGVGALETTAALLGPFWRDKSPSTRNGASIVRSPTPGERLWVMGHVRTADGAPVSGARVDVWQSSPKGFYDNQDPDQADMNLRGRFETDAEGAFTFWSVRPAGYPVPTHGPSGELMRAQRRPPWRPAHLHFLTVKPGMATLVTQVFIDEPDALADDVVFGVAKDLVGRLEPREDVDGAFLEITVDLVVAPGVSRLPTPPIA